MCPSLYRGDRTDKSHRDLLNEKCRIQPDDGPFLRELKAVLAPPLAVPNFLSDSVDLAPDHLEGVIETPHIRFKRSDLLLRSLRPMHAYRHPPRSRRPGPGNQIPYHVLDLVLGAHALTLSRFWATVKRFYSERPIARHLDRRTSVRVEHTFP